MNIASPELCKQLFELRGLKVGKIAEALPYVVFWIGFFGCIATIGVVNRVHQLKPNPADLIYAKHCADKGQGALIKHYNNEDSYECK